MSGAYITNGERAILNLLAKRSDGCTVKEIVEHCNSTPGSVRVLIHRLRAKGFPITSPCKTSFAGPRKGIRQAYQLLPDGVFDRGGELMFTCLSCEQDFPLPIDLSEFHPETAYCGGSPRCLP